MVAFSVLFFSHCLLMVSLSRFKSRVTGHFACHCTVIEQHRECSPGFLVLTPESY